MEDWAGHLTIRLRSEKHGSFRGIVRSIRSGIEFFYATTVPTVMNAHDARVERHEGFPRRTPQSPSNDEGMVVPVLGSGPSFDGYAGF